MKHKTISYAEESRPHFERIVEVCGRRKPLLVVKCETFNHENYLCDALEGFVMQKTDFPFVAIVHDDASTDRTGAVIKEYTERYPDIILPIYETENQYSKNDGSLSCIMLEACAATGAKYIALCEGDDYWTDPDKLQRQVSFLESNPDYSLCFHNAMVHYEDGKRNDHCFACLEESREYSEKELTGSWIAATASFVMRSSVYDSDYYKEYIRNSNKFMVGDLPTLLCCIRCGKVFGFHDVMSVYRINPGGWTQHKQDEYKLIVQHIEIIRIFGGYTNNASRRHIVLLSRAGVPLLFKGRIKDAFRIWKVSFRYAPLKILKENIKFVFKLLKNRSAKI